MDPVFEEISRVREGKDIRHSKLREWQAYLRDVVQPQLDELNALKADPVPVKKRAVA
jgi:hypothetical protein